MSRHAARIADIIHAIDNSEPLSQPLSQSQTSSQSRRIRPEFVIPADAFPPSPGDAQQEEEDEQEEEDTESNEDDPAEEVVEGINRQRMPDRPTRSREVSKRTASQSDAVEIPVVDGEPSRKRRRAGDAEDGSSQSEPDSSQALPIEIAHLEEDGVLGSALQKQREDQVKSQQQSQHKDEPTATKLSKMQCVICMDSFTDMTTTSCGHLFCHACLISALKASETRRYQATGHSGKKSQCPVCRKQLNRTSKNDIIPLLLLKAGLATQPRRART